MLNVQCGVYGKVRIKKENSITGEVTHESEFDNVWTDAGLSHLGCNTTKTVFWPNRLLYGSGIQPEPLTQVTALASYIGYGSVSYGVEGGVANDEAICTVTRTSSIVVQARGVSWTLSELGLGYNNERTLTYTPTRNELGVPTPVPVTAIEIVTIYYTIQLQFPMSLPPMPVVVAGLPPTTATFTLKPQAAVFARDTVGQCYMGVSNNSYHFGGFTNSGYGGQVAAKTVGGKITWDINTLNRTTSFFGCSTGSVSHVWELSPPITKNNTQIFEFDARWDYSNALPIEV